MAVVDEESCNHTPSPNAKKYLFRKSLLNILYSHAFPGEESSSKSPSPPSESSADATYTSESKDFEDLDFGSSSGLRKLSKRQGSREYDQVLMTYQNLHSANANERFEILKNKILSYSPGSSTANVGNYDVPKTTTTLILVGPVRSGKSTLVNKILAVLRAHDFDYDPAQVSCSSNAVNTLFLHEYMMLRNSHSLCLYDTPSLSDDISQNDRMLERWMKKGVRDGEWVYSKYDGEYFKDALKARARRQCSSSLSRQVDYAIFVVNGVDVLRSRHEDSLKKSMFPLIMAFNNPSLSFKDDKPVIAITHGDLLSVSDRIRVRRDLCKMLGVNPASQMFDIPDGDDLSTKLPVVEMLNYTLHRADRNFPYK